MAAGPDALACRVRVGRLDIERCRELGVPFGSRRGKLKEGVPVLSDTGEEVLPHQVCYCRPPCVGPTAWTDMFTLLFSIPVRV